MEYAKRVHRDMQNLFSHDFTSSSTSLRVSDVPETEELLTWRKMSSGGSLHTVMISICAHEGPYRGGHFIFYLNIPENYPFRGVDVWADMSRPVWHPNVELETGRVLLPLTWSPVLTLTSLALAIQMMLLEPSADNPLNLEACSFYSANPVIFEKCVQKTLGGYVVGHVQFQRMDLLQCECCQKQRQARAAAAAAASVSLPLHLQRVKRRRSSGFSSTCSGMQVSSSQGFADSDDDDADAAEAEAAGEGVDLHANCDESDDNEQEFTENSSNLSARSRKRHLERTERLEASYTDGPDINININIGQLSKEFGAILEKSSSPTPASAGAAPHAHKRGFSSMSLPMSAEAAAAAQSHRHRGLGYGQVAGSGSGSAEGVDGMELECSRSASRSGSLGGEECLFSRTSTSSAQRSAFLSTRYSPAKRARGSYEPDTTAATGHAGKGFVSGTGPPMPLLQAFTSLQTSADANVAVLTGPSRGSTQMHHGSSTFHSSSSSPFSRVPVHGEFVPGPASTPASSAASGHRSK